MKTRNVAILIFNNVEVLDFTGPYEVFNDVNRVTGENYFQVFTISENGDQITARNGLKIIPDFSIENCPAPDILIIPGGQGRKIVMNDIIVTGWITEQYKKLELLLSVCTGAFIIGKTGLLKGLKATTHHESYTEFEETFRDTELVKNVKYIDNGKIITSGGIASGIDMSLYVIGKLLGKDIAQLVKTHLEY